VDATGASSTEALNAAFAPIAVLLALIALTRSLLTRKESGWRRYRIGLFIERDPHDRIG
jgi:hypothetical protein